MSLTTYGWERVSVTVRGKVSVTEDQERPTEVDSVGHICEISMGLDRLLFGTEIKSQWLYQLSRRPNLHKLHAPREGPLQRIPPTSREPSIVSLPA